MVKQTDKVLIVRDRADLRAAERPDNRIAAASDVLTAELASSATRR